MTWLSNGNLQCSTCTNKVEYPGPRAVVLNAARAHGWHCFNGMSLTLKPIEEHLCDECIGTARKKLEKKGPMEADVPLFEVRAEIQDVIDARNHAKNLRP